MNNQEKNDQQQVKKGRTLSHLLIEPFKQIRFGLYMMGLCVLFVCVSGWIFMSTWSQQYQRVMLEFALDEDAKKAFLSDDIFISNSIKLFCFFLLFIMVMFFTIFKLTHRYYGPLVSIGRFLDQMIKGNYSARVSIRKKDELQQIAQKLNELAGELEKKHGSSESE